MFLFYHFGRYIILLGHCFLASPEKLSMYWKEIVRQIYDIGIGSFGIVAIVATFIGAVTAVQFSEQLIGIGFIPMWWMGLIVRDSMMLELAPTITAMLLAGKIGSNIATEIGTMRTSEQIDALEIMGVNTPGYLIAPKIVAAMVSIPMLVILALALGLGGGWAAGVSMDYYTSQEYVKGLQDGMDAYYLFLMLLKSVINGFIITSISCYQGYFVKGGPLELGAASTRAVVISNIAIIVANFLVASLLL